MKATGRNLVENKERMNNQTANKGLKSVLNIPNTVTTVRVVLSAVVAVLLLNSQFLAAGIVLVIAACTDWLDGFLARKLNLSGLFGSLFDMVADELLFMPNLIIAIIMGLFSRVNGLMPFNPYPYAVPAVAGGAAVFSGIITYLLKRRRRHFEFPTPTGIAKVNFWFWLAPLILAIFRIGPDWLLATMMYLAIISTILTFYSYLKKGSYVFTD